MTFPAKSPASDNAVRQYNMELRTSDATQSTLHSIHTYAGGAYQVKAFVLCKTANAGAVSGWEITGTFKNVAGTASIVGALDTIGNADNASSVTVSVTGNQITVLVTGVAATSIVWVGSVDVRRIELAQ